MSEPHSNSRKHWGMIGLVGTLAAILMVMLVPIFGSGLIRCPMPQAVNNARSLHIASHAAALDRSETGDATVGWPGDLPVKSNLEYARFLVKAGYLGPDDVRVFSGAGVEPAKTLDTFTEENLAFTFYRVAEEDGEKAVFITTKNYDYMQPLDPKRQPYGDKGFVVFRKAGDGSYYGPRQYDRVEVIGTLPAARPAVLPQE